MLSPYHRTVVQRIRVHAENKLVSPGAGRTSTHLLWPRGDSPENMFVLACLYGSEKDRARKENDLAALVLQYFAALVCYDTPAYVRVDGHVFAAIGYFAHCFAQRCGVLMRSIGSGTDEYLPIDPADRCGSIVVRHHTTFGWNRVRAQVYRKKAWSNVLTGKGCRIGQCTQFCGGVHDILSCRLDALYHAISWSQYWGKRGSFTRGGARYNGPMKITVFDTDERVREVFSSVLSEHDITYVEGPATKETLAQYADSEVISVFVSSGCSRELIDALPKVKFIAARSTGVDHIDCVYAKEKGIAVANVPRYGARTVAEFAFALMLTLSRHIFDATRQVREDGSFRIATFEGFDLFGKTIGVVGTGAIGRSVVQIAQGFGMKVLMMDKFPNQQLEGESAKYVSLDELLAQSDIVTLHVPYIPENHHLMNAAAFSKLKKGALVINTARGELIDTEALLEALKSGVVGGAGLDVLEGERSLKDEMSLVRGSESIQDLKGLVRNHILMDMPQVIITPHIAFYSKEAYHEILSVSADNIKSFAGGKPTNVVNV